MAQRSLDLIKAMADICEAAHPITGRGVGYKLFTRGLNPSMGRADMQRVYRLLKEARERGMVPWGWIVDESRELERVSSWDDPADYAECVVRCYRRDYWSQQPVRVEVWSEKGTVRGVLAPVLNEYGVGFRVMHGFGSATEIHDIAMDDDGRRLVALYVGDHDPSGLYMSMHDLPERLAKYEGDHVYLRRIALLPEQLNDLPCFPASDKKTDPRYRWFVEQYGDHCCELDALDPNGLRDLVEEQINQWIVRSAWDRCKRVEEAERESIQTVLGRWLGA
jgi:hypothetical protein